MATVAFFLSFMLAVACIDLRAKWRRSRLTAPPLARRLPAPRLYKVAAAQLFIALALAVSYAMEGWTLASVGVHRTGLWLESILAGEVTYFGLLLAYGVSLRVLGLMTQMRMAANRGNLRAWPRGRTNQWIAAIAFMVFNPFTEELVMRGLLIHQWGELLGSPLLPIAVGFALNATLHWYQGWRMQLWHALFFTAAVSLLYSPWGLTAAITAHVFGDTLPFLNLRRNLLTARAARRVSINRQTTK